MKSAETSPPGDWCPDATRKLISSREVVFWDFDGVIKESLSVKAAAFESLFRPYGLDVAARVREHHEANGGVSRYKKMPLYMSWAGLSNEECRVEEYCKRFSELVVGAVIDSPWVGGVREYLSNHFQRQYFVLLTATPQREIELILLRLDIAHFFRHIIGAPTSKTEAIANLMRERPFDKSAALVVGDSATDLEAALANGLTFLLRRNSTNKGLQSRYRGPQFEDLVR